MEPWRRTGARRIRRCGIFDLDEVTFEPPDGRPTRPFYVIEAPDWINVIALTSDDEVLLVRQFRFGIEELTLEIPGGMCDPGETPEQAARRELLEETGYECDGPLEHLGWVHPNPPIQNNRCHTFLARGVTRRGEPRPDESESFEIERVPLTEIAPMFADGRISHALVLAAFTLYDAALSGRRSSG